MRTLPLWAVADARPSNVDKKSKPGESAVRLVNYTDVYYNQMIHPEMDLMEASASAEHIERFGVHAGDLIITKDSETPDDIGIPAIVSEAAPDMVCAYHLSLLRPDVAKIDPKFLYWYLESNPAKAHWYTSAFGVTRYSIQGGAVAHLPIPDLDGDTQKRIVSYLDREITEIDAMITKLDGLGETLRLRRLRENQVVLAGFPRVPLGIYCRIVNGSTPLRSRDDYWSTSGGFPWLNSAAVNNAVVLNAPRQVTSIAMIECHLPRVRPGDVLIGITGQGRTRGMVARSGIECTISQHVAAVQTHGGWDSRFLYYALDAEYRNLRSDSESAGSTKGAITCAMLSQYRVPLPPLDEQIRIAGELDVAAARVDAMLAKVADLKTLLLERRAALITDVVTGKKEVA